MAHISGSTSSVKSVGNMNLSSSNNYKYNFSDNKTNAMFDHQEEIIDYNDIFVNIPSNFEGICKSESADLYNMKLFLYRDSKGIRTGATKTVSHYENYYSDVLELKGTKITNAKTGAAVLDITKKVDVDSKGVQTTTQFSTGSRVWKKQQTASIGGKRSDPNLKNTLTKIGKYDSKTGEYSNKAVWVPLVLWMNDRKMFNAHTGKKNLNEWDSYHKYNNFDREIMGQKVRSGMTLEGVQESRNPVSAIKNMNQYMKDTGGLDSMIDEIKTQNGIRRAAIRGDADYMVGGNVKGKNVVVARASAGAEWNLLQAKGSKDIVTEYGTKYGGSFEADLLHAEASATAEVDLGYVSASAYAEVCAAKVKASGYVGLEEGGYDIFDAGLSGDAQVLAANAKASVGFGVYRDEHDKLRIDAGVTLEANAELCSASATGTVSVLGVEGAVTGKVKVGAAAQLQCGVQDGKFNFKIGIAIGVGFEIGGSFDISGAISNVKVFISNVTTYAEITMEGLGKIKDFVVDIGEIAVDNIVEVGEVVLDGIVNVGEKALDVICVWNWSIWD